MSNPNPARHHEWRAPDGEIYRLIDAPQGFMQHLAPPSARACKKAKTLDPNHCALAEQWMIQERVPVAQIGTDKCYLPLWQNGELIVYRCRIRGERDKARIDYFDKTGEWPDGEGLWVYGIPPSQTLDSRRAKDKRLRERWATMDTPRKRKPLVRVHLRDASLSARIHVTQA